MNYTDVLGILDTINSYLDREEYQEASDYIKKKKQELSEIKNCASEYIDTLVKDLK